MKLSPIQSNAGIDAAYRKKLQAMTAEMANSYIYWISAAWKQTAPIAQDSSHTVNLRDVMARLGRRWNRKFDVAANSIAAKFAAQSIKHFDRSMMSALKDAGFTVDFKMTAPVAELARGILSENVALIKSIPAQFHKDVEGHVWHAVNRGGDLGALTDVLKERYGVTHNRAALIARDQNSKAHAIIENARRQEIGMTRAIWRHGGAGKEPRPSHLSANGKTYELDKGMYLDGVWTYPKHEINCLPGDSKIEFAAGCKKMWRRWHDGELTELVTSSGEKIKATPNHPILTRNGWLPIKSVDVGDYVISVGNQIGDFLKADVQTNEATVEEVFNTMSLYIPASVTGCSRSKFHGDASNNEVDTVNIDGFLMGEIDAYICQKFCELFFPKAMNVLVRAGFNPDGSLLSACNRLFCSPERIIGGFCMLLPLLKSHSPHARNICLGLTADMHASIDKACSDAGTSSVIAMRKLKLANSRLVLGDNQIVRELFAILSRASVGWNDKTHCAEALGQRVSSNAKSGGGNCDVVASGYEFHRIVKKSVGEFSGHVYNLETWFNWYSSNTYIIHNCRCTSIGIIEAFVQLGEYEKYGVR